MSKGRSIMNLWASTLYQVLMGHLENRSSCDTCILVSLATPMRTGEIRHSLNNCYVRICQYDIVSHNGFLHAYNPWTSQSNKRGTLTD
jgi:hypothetical protein